MHKILFYNKFISCLYMFRAPCAHVMRSKLYYTLYIIISSSVFYSLQLINTRSCNCGCTSSWRRVSTPETRRAVYRNIINWLSRILLDSCWIQLYYTASGIITPAGGRPVHRLREDTGFPWHGHQISGHKGPVKKTYVHRDRKGSNL